MMVIMRLMSGVNILIRH